jgi:O-antigen ligase
MTRRSLRGDAVSKGAATAPSGRRLATAASTTLGDSRWAVLTMIGLALYLAFLVLPKAAESAIDVADDDLRVYQIAGVLAFVGSVVVPLFARPGLRRFVAGVWGSTIGIAILGTLLASAGLAVMFEGDVVAAVYALLTIGVLVACSVFWAMPRPLIQRACGAFAVLGLAFCGFALWKYGVSSPGRFVGSLTPNHFANIALAAVILGTLGPSFIRFAVVPIGVALTLPVNSRGTLVAIVVMLLVRWGLRLTSERRVVALGGMSVACGLLALLVLHPGLRTTVGNVAEDVLAMDDLSRGAGSGGTGRLELWRDAFDAIAERPLAGAGFRAVRQSDGRISTAHNAYIDLFQEIGIPLATTLIGCLTVALVRRVRSARIAIAEESAQLWIAGGLLAIASNAIFEVHLLNIGFPLSVVFMLLLTANRGLSGVEGARYRPDAVAPVREPGAPAGGDPIWTPRLASER